MQKDTLSRKQEMFLFTYILHNKDQNNVIIWGRKEIYLVLLVVFNLDI